MAWNHKHAGVAAAPPVAIDWSVTAMTEAAVRLSAPGAWDLPRAAAAVGETVWWVTLVDATLVRYHLRDYERALASKVVRRRKTEETLEGLRYVRNQLGRSVDPAEFVCPAADGDSTAWAWRPLPEPGLGALTPRARQWELSRYRAYQARLAGRDITRTFARCTEFLAQAAGLVGGGAPPGPGSPGLRSGKQAASPVPPMSTPSSSADAAQSASSRPPAALDPAARRAVEGSFAGLRFIRGQLGYHADPATSSSHPPAAAPRPGPRAYHACPGPAQRVHPQPPGRGPAGRGIGRLRTLCAPAAG
jgi:hypothetical protein